MRQLIAGMKISLDGRYEGADGMADWVEAWSNDYALPEIDACILGAGMYPGYEGYWTGIQNEPGKSHWITGKTPTAGELEWARVGARLPHYVLSSKPVSAQWPSTRFLRSFEEVAALKKQPGEGLYVVGGGRTTAGLIDAGLVDELRLIVYPVIAGNGKELFGAVGQRRGLALKTVKPLDGGKVFLTYGTS
ncbi:MAG TPA: dihydrofolate reductase family protein [Thermoanaerobaculia bacterium]|nr:dihydrofolate reductase family protein [Thermoanaerobaculia bacterium]